MKSELSYQHRYHSGPWKSLTRGENGLAGGEDGAPEIVPIEHLGSATAVSQFVLHVVRDASVVFINGGRLWA